MKSPSIAVWRIVVTGLSPGPCGTIPITITPSAYWCPPVMIPCTSRRSGLPSRILFRRSVCSPVITPLIRIRALTPTITPPIAITLISDSRREPRRLRR
ncbi:MAG: hypothetical protein B7Z72_05555 [Gemmatimonadetes bacterium 21-71-4]|nr:MAG: hypothetical protein B7Z72_05555 [Gemmatimonadetes bacterium 21-71-4]